MATAKKTKKKKVAKKRLTRKSSGVGSLTERQKGALRKSSAQRKPQMVYDDLSIDEMEEVQQWTASEGGFQRKLSMKQVNGVASFLLRSPVPILPPVILAKIRGSRARKRWCIDGQHRLKGALLAGISISAVTISVHDLEEARYLFMVYNSKATKISNKFIGLISHNEVATETRQLANDYDAFYEHIKRLGTGLLGGTTTRYWDEVAHDGSIPANDIRRMRLVLDQWTSDKRWRPDKFPEEKAGEVTRCVAKNIVANTKSFYCVPGTLQVIGAVIRELNLQTKEQIETVVTVAQDTFKFKSPTWRQHTARNGMDTWCDLVNLLKSNVAKHALTNI